MSFKMDRRSNEYQANTLLLKITKDWCATHWKKYLTNDTWNWKLFLTVVFSSLFIHINFQCHFQIWRLNASYKVLNAFKIQPFNEVFITFDWNSLLFYGSGGGDFGIQMWKSVHCYKWGRKLLWIWVSLITELTPALFKLSNYPFLWVRSLPSELGELF